jgi:protein kinase
VKQPLQISTRILVSVACFRRVSALFSETWKSIYSIFRIGFSTEHQIIATNHSLFLFQFLCTQVAIKCMKRRYPVWDEIPKLREFRSLNEMSSYQHKNIVQLEEVVRESNQRLYFVFEYMPDGNLYEFIKQHTPTRSPLNGGITTAPLLTESKIRSIMSQILEGLDFLHSKGYIHRDIKPENILMKGSTCKLADFGLARECSCQAQVTDYVSTRWYRAPEVLLRSPYYGKPIDLFGMGCILAELYSKIPLFPGENELEQIYIITQILGTPKERGWLEGVNLANKLGLNFKRDRPLPLSQKVPMVSPEGLNFMTSLLEWNPKNRPTCADALRHKYFLESNSTPAVQSTPVFARTKRSAPIAISPPAEPVNKMRRMDDSSPRSISEVYHGAWTFPPELPFSYR